MNNSYIHILIWCIPSLLFSQYDGGNDFNKNLFSCYSHQLLTTNNYLYQGGLSSLNNNYCFQQTTTNNSYPIFKGGTSSLNIVDCFIQTTNNPSSPFFKGGNSSSHISDCFAQSMLAINDEFYGGGMSSSQISDCNAQGDIVQNNFFFGGLSNDMTQSCFEHQFSSNYEMIYFGGSSSANLVDCYAQDIAISFPNIFKGGSTPNSFIGCSDITFPISTLPIELISFYGYPEDDYNILNWITASEINNDFFTLYKSIDAVYWEEHSIISGAGNSNVIIEYEETDYEPNIPITYYRLKQTDLDGTETLSNIISIKRNNKALELDILSIYPNPTSNYFNVKYTSEGEEVELKIFDNIGKLILQKNFDSSEGINIQKITLENISKGYYTVSFSSNGTKKSYKLLYTK